MVFFFHHNQLFIIKEKMKHILNNLSEEEKNAIREQHAGGMKVITENFSKLLNSKLGDVKPLVNEQTMASNLLSGSSQKAVKQVFDSCRNAGQSPINTNKIVDGIYKAVQGIGTDETAIITALTNTGDFQTFCSAVKNYKTTYGTDLYSDLDGDIDEETLWSQISRILRGLTQKQQQRLTPKSGGATTSRVKPKPSNFVDPKVKRQQMMQGQTTRPTAPQPSQVRPSTTRPTAQPGPNLGRQQRPTAPQPSQVRPSTTRPTSQPGPNLGRQQRPNYPI